MAVRTDKAVLPPAGAVGIGTAGGVVGGLLGGGSGVLFVPALDRFAGLSRHRLHGTSTVANIAVTAVGAAVYAFAGAAVDLRSGSGLIVGGIAGGFLGARLLARVPDRLLRLLFIAILILTGAKLFLGASGLDPLGGGALLPAGILAELWVIEPLAVVVGVLIGAWSAAMGLGGGLLAVPAMMLLFGADMHTAEGTSLLVFLPTAIAGAIVHLRQATAVGGLSGQLSIGAVPGTLVGALLGLALNSVVLGLVFGTFALVMAGREIRQLRRASAGRQPAAEGMPAAKGR